MVDWWPFNQETFEFCMKKYQLGAKLKRIGPKFLKPEWKKKWTRNRPTTGYCYLISEICFHYLYPNTEAYVMRVNGGTHWFLKSQGKIIDWTGDQFQTKVLYERGRHAAFFQGSVKTSRGFISKKAHLLAQQLGIIY